MAQRRLTAPHRTNARLTIIIDSPEAVKSTRSQAAAWVSQVAVIRSVVFYGAGTSEDSYFLNVRAHPKELSDIEVVAIQFLGGLPVSTTTLTWRPAPES
jgi:hypothetical protein